jgi:hypothetical protein
MTGLKSVLLGMAAALLPVICGGSIGWAGNAIPQRHGKVVVIRGAFTVFSLGLNELGEKLAKYGLDVEVIADISSDATTSKLIDEYRRRPDMGPIIFVGHSRGAELGPREAAELQTHKIPVKLIVMVDAVHPVTIPANVERCVNLYHNSSIGFIHGVAAKAKSRKTQLRNIDIDRLPSRDEAGSINHFNIDASPWIHDLVIKEVLDVCPLAHPRAVAATAKKTAPAHEHLSAPAVTRRSGAAVAPPSSARVARRESGSGIRRPSGSDAESGAAAASKDRSITDRPRPVSDKRDDLSALKDSVSSGTTPKSAEPNKTQAKKAPPVQTHLTDETK